MVAERTRVGHELETALGEVLAQLRGETVLPCRIVGDAAAEHSIALRKPMIGNRGARFRFGLPGRSAVRIGIRKP